MKKVGLRCSNKPVHKGKDAVRKWEAPMLSLSAYAITRSPLSSGSVATLSGKLKKNCCLSRTNIQKCIPPVLFTSFQNKTIHSYRVSCCHFISAQSCLSTVYSTAKAKHKAKH